jgi:hypothetical protein
MNILEACRDPNLFGRWFRDDATWKAWFAFLAALFALPMTKEQRKVYRTCTDRDRTPRHAFTEGWLICGRRAGKSFVLALVAVFLACFKSYAEYLGPGERATILVLATDRKQARVIMRYVKGLITGTPMLARMLEGEPRAEGLDLTNGVTIEVATASYRATRGYTIVAALCDELAFWPTDDSAEPDYEILDAIRPGTATIPNAMLLCASSPYAKRGALWDTFKRSFAKNDPGVLVWKAPTWVMNPTVPQSFIDREYERDPAKASGELGAEFRTDVSSYITREAVEAVVSPDVRERGPLPRMTYTAFCDPSGGASDSMTIGIAHREGNVGILDAIRERRPPFSPESVVEEFAGLMRRYGIRRVRGDRYAGLWPADAFRRYGITYIPAEKTKSQIYQDFLPILNSGDCDLLDEPRITAQLVGLERRTSRGGRDSIDKAPGSHDDLANAVAGALVEVATRKAVPIAQTGVYHYVR